MSLKEIHSLDYTVLLCSTLEATKAFYRDVMGFPVELDGENWVNLRVGSAVLALRRRLQGPLPFVDGQSMPGSASVQLAFRVPLSVLESCHEELVAKDVTVVRGPTDLPGPRHRTVFFRDPEGNLLEIYADY